MTNLKDLEKQLEEHWKRTEEKRNLTHTKSIYLRIFKNNKEMM